MRIVLLVALVCGSTCTIARAVVIPTVPVGNAGNASDYTGRGGVAYDYRIGATEVTNSQYAEFLNAKVASDPLNLYHVFMGSMPLGGITRTGVSGNYTYTVKANMADKPVNYVDWFDAVRFVNWINNGQGNGDTETGAYTLLGGTPVPTNNATVSRNSGASWFLPSIDEWYKAAFHQPASQGGDVDDYWRYPTASNAKPTRATANSVGDISNPGANVANFNDGALWNGQTGNLTTVGSAGPLSNSFYGTADQGGNVWEWTETWMPANSNRAMRGGAYDSIFESMRSNDTSAFPPNATTNYLGFRVATLAVPEPSTIALAAIGVAVLLAFNRRTFKPL